MKSKWFLVCITVTCLQALAQAYSTTPRTWYRNLGASFGQSVSNAGDVNGDGYDDALVGMPSASRAFVFYGSAAGLSDSHTQIISPVTGYNFAFYVSAAGDVNGDSYDDVLVGQHGYSRTYLYYGSPDGIRTANGTYSTFAGIGGLGEKVAAAGDINNDGYADFLLAAAASNRAFAFYGSEDGFATNQIVNVAAADWTYPYSGGSFGFGLAGAGDVNGDGFDDVFVSSMNSGVVFGFYGAAQGLPNSPSWVKSAANCFGRHIAPAGDVNGDGYDDVLIGTQGGQVFAFYGSSPGLQTNHDWYLPWGIAVSSAGDFNHDGFDDVMIGHYGENRVNMYYGSAAGLPIGATAATADWWSAGECTYFGYTLSDAGDLNGDGHDDIIVGSSNIGYALAWHGFEQDSDEDGIPDRLDNCPDIYNPAQSDRDGDGIGDECDFGYGGGDGTAEHPYQIWFDYDLETLDRNPENWDKHFILMRDIDLAYYDQAPQIGTYIANGNPDNTPFTGTFDGNGRTISNMTILKLDDESHSGVGLFEYIGAGAVIRNLHLENIFINVGQTASGLVGGLVGMMQTGSVQNCSVSGNVQGRFYVGGLVGLTTVDSLIEGCRAEVDVYGENSVGGFVGSNAGVIANCYSEGSVIASGIGTLGGFVGASSNGKIENCYSLTALPGIGGGFAGSHNTESAQVSGCFWDIEASGKDGSAAGTGLNTAPMQTLSTFAAAGWDFATPVWKYFNFDYPRLGWEPDYPRADLSRNHRVDLQDLQMLAAQWLDGI